MLDESSYNLSQRVAHGEIILLVRVKFEQLFYILHIEASRNICRNCPAHSNYMGPKVGRSSGESVVLELQISALESLFHFSSVVGPWMLATASQSLSLPIYKMQITTTTIIIAYS